MKRYLSVLCALLMAVLCLFGCTPTAPASTPASTPAPDSNQPEASTPAPAEQPAGDAPVEIRFMWWGSDSRHQATLEAIDKYTELNPNVTISAEYGGWDGYYQKLVTQIAGESAADAIQMDNAWFTELQRRGSVVVDMRTLPQVNPADFAEAMIEACTKGGILVGLPTGIIAEQWFCLNLDFFNKYGLDPNVEFTWDSLHEIGSKLHAENPDVYLFFTGKEDLATLMKIYHVQKTGEFIISDDYTVNMDLATVQEYLEYAMKLIEDGVVYPLEFVVAGEDTQDSLAWQTQVVGMYDNPLSGFPATIAASEFEIGDACIPIMDNAKDTGVEVRPAQIMSIYNKSTKIDQTADFLVWLLGSRESATILKDSRGIPSNTLSRQVLEESGAMAPIMPVVIEKAFAKAGAAPSDLNFNEEVSKIMADAVDLMAYKRITPAEAAQQIVDQVTTKVAELKADAGLS